MSRLIPCLKRETAGSEWVKARILTPAGVIADGLFLRGGPAVKRPPRNS